MALKNDYQGMWGLGRILASILQYNNPNLWIFKLFDYLHIAALPVTILAKLLRIFNQRFYKQKIDHTPEYQNKARTIKAAQRKQFMAEAANKSELAHPFAKSKKE